MKKLLYTFALMVLCLSLMTVSASAMVQYNSYNVVPNGGAYGYGMMPPQPQGPGLTTQYCSRWIPGHWIQVNVMRPGRMVYVVKRVWIPSYPVAQTRWVPGFWQTTGANTRPDLQIWGSPQMGWYGRPYQQQTGGYFTPQGMWVPAQ